MTLTKLFYTFAAVILLMAMGNMPVYAKVNAKITKGNVGTTRNWTDPETGKNLVLPVISRKGVVKLTGDASEASGQCYQVDGTQIVFDAIFGDLSYMTEYISVQDVLDRTSLNYTTRVLEDWEKSFRQNYPSEWVYIVREGGYYDRNWNYHEGNILGFYVTLSGTSTSNATNKTATVTAKNGWIQDAQGIWNYWENGVKATGWREINGKIYYFGTAGDMYHSGQYVIDGKTYEFNTEGHFVQIVPNAAVQVSSNIQTAPRVTEPLFSNPDGTKTEEGKFYFEAENPYSSNWTCTRYAYGRAWEIIATSKGLTYEQAVQQGVKSNLGGSAAEWYLTNDIYQFYASGSEPRVGAIACWGGNNGNNGHVAIVESIDANGVITVSEAWANKKNRMVETSTKINFHTRQMDANGKYASGSSKGKYLNGDFFQGYIYLDEPLR